MVVGARSAPLQLGFAASERVRSALAALGRTEDVRFAPSGSRLAIACYASERIAVAEVEIARTSSGLEIAVASVVELGSETLDEPHGLDFLDDETIVVGNRGGGVGLFRLPADDSPDLVKIGGIEDGASGLLGSPGSIVVRSLGSGRYELLACNNWQNTVTRHVVDASGGAATGEVILARRLELPDGLAVSADGRWLAVSNHDAHAVLVYAYETADAAAEPVGVLRGVLYPHGVRFADDDRRLLAADAGAPHVHVFAASGGSWAGARYPDATIVALDEDTFARGRRNPAEGGPKGIDVDGTTNVLAATCEEQPLAFFDLEGAFENDVPGDVEQAFARYELLALDEREELRTQVAEARAQLAELEATKAWRMTAPVRRAYGAALRLRTRRRDV